MNTELINNAADSYAMLKTSHFLGNFYKKIRRALKNRVLFLVISSKFHRHLVHEGHLDNFCVIWSYNQDYAVCQ